MKLYPQVNRQKGTLKVEVKVTDADARLLPDMSVRVNFLAEAAAAAPGRADRARCRAARSAATSTRATSGSSTTSAYGAGRSRSGTELGDQVQVASGARRRRRRWSSATPRALSDGAQVRVATSSTALQARTCQREESDPIASRRHAWVEAGAETLQAHIRTLMNAQVVMVGPDTPLIDVAREIAAHGIGAVPVVDEEQRLLGLVSTSDLVGLLHDGRRLRGQDGARRDERRAARDRRVRDRRGRRSTSLRNALIRHLPVTREGRLVGLVTASDLIRHLLKHHPAPEVA